MQFDRQFSGSFFRILGEHNDAFFDTFYEKFMASSEEVREKFKNTDMKKQKKMLKKSLYTILDFFLHNNITPEMERIAAVHNKNHHDIGSHLYDQWTECLIETVREYDPKFNKKVELAWRMVISSGITYMRFKYDK